MGGIVSRFEHPVEQMGTVRLGAVHGNVTIVLGGGIRTDVGLLGQNQSSDANDRRQKQDFSHLQQGQ